MPEFIKEFRYDNIRGSDFSMKDAYESATAYSIKVNGVVSHKDGKPSIGYEGNKSYRYYVDPSCWPAYVVTYNAEEEIPE